METTKKEEKRDLVEVTNFFYGGDEKRAEIRARPEQQCDCGNPQCSCYCPLGNAAEGSWFGNWDGNRTILRDRGVNIPPCRCAYECICTCATLPLAASNANTEIVAQAWQQASKQSVGL